MRHQTCAVDYHLNYHCILSGTLQLHSPLLFILSCVVVLPWFPSLTVVLSPAVPSDYVHLGVVSLLLAVDSDEDVFEDTGRVDVSLRDVGHEGCSLRLGAHTVALLTHTH